MPAVALAMRIVPVEEQLAAVKDGSATMAFVRLPVDRQGLHVIPLYSEQNVVVAPKDHPIAAFDELDVAELSEEYLLADPDDFPEWRDISAEIVQGTRKPLPAMGTLEESLDLVEAGLGILILPMSVARLHSRKTLRSRPVHGLRESSIALAWIERLQPRPAEEEAVIQEFVGVVRGRSANSSRQPSVQAKQEAGAKKKTKSSTPARGKSAKSGTAKSNVRGGGRPGAKQRAQKRGRKR